MRNKYLISFVMVIFLLILAGGVTVWYEKDKDKAAGASAYNEELRPAKEVENPMKGILEDFTVTEEFSSQLPLVILDMNGEEPPINTERQKVNGEYIFMNIEGIDPYVYGEISVINTGSENHITDKVESSSRMQIKRRGNTSMLYEKAQYMVKLITQKEQENKVELLGMGADNEWILNGSMADKSMMRNYLAYRVSSHIMPYTPDYKYCEVIIKDQDVYRYQGVYLLGESIKQGKNRVDIASCRESDYQNSFLVRRDRYDEDGVMLDTYAEREGLAEGEIGLLYPGKNSVTKEAASYAAETISRVEEILYSNDYEVFSTYSRYIDVDSFVDYFLVNEFFASYDSGTYSTYMYQDLGGKLSMGPVWDYDGTMDNYIDSPLETEVMAFQTKPLFERLITDKAFVKKLEARYLELRKTWLSDTYIDDTITAIWNYLGPAQEREWKRWEAVYMEKHTFSLLPYEDEEGDMVERDTRQYENEIYRLKTILKQHGQSIYGRLVLLERTVLWTTGWQSRTDIWLLVVLLVIGGSVFYIRRT